MYLHLVQYIRLRRVAKALIILSFIIHGINEIGKFTSLAT